MNLTLLDMWSLHMYERICSYSCMQPTLRKTTLFGKIHLSILRVLNAMENDVFCQSFI